MGRSEAPAFSQTCPGGEGDELQQLENRLDCEMRNIVEKWRARVYFQYVISVCVMLDTLTNAAGRYCTHTPFTPTHS